MNFIFEAILLGLTLAIMPGPILVTLIETALSYTRKEGFFVGLGIWISDILIMAICLSFVDQISETINSPQFKIALGLIGGVILVVMGIGNFIKKNKIEINSEKKQKAGALLSFTAKGFFINTLNPFTFIFWLGVVSTYTIGRGIDSKTMILFLSTIISVIALTDIIKVILSDRVSSIITGKAINNITKISGIGLIFFGIILIIRAFL